MAENTKMGRPLGFAESEALEAAMKVFWEKGFEGLHARRSDRGHGYQSIQYVRDLWR
jgi:hypothetical protein